MERTGLAALLALCLAAACGGGSEERVVRSVVLVTLDTTRADALGCYGGPAGVTPSLDELAEQSLTYDFARTVAPLTLPSHTSMMTGLYPPRHRVHDNVLDPVPQAARTLAEAAREEGIETAAFLSAVVLDRPFGLDQGFDVYDLPPRRRAGQGRPTPDRPASETIAAVERWLDGRDPARPVFLWVHLFDPHEPYEPPPQYLGVAKNSRYLAEIAAMDAGIGRLVGALSKARVLDEALLVVVGDHGEGLGQRGELTHGPYVYENVLRVPFLVRYPDGYRAGERSDEVVSVADVFPTALDALRLPRPAGLDGLSLFRAEVPEDRGVYFESFYGFLNYGWSPLAGWADASTKYIHSTTPELYAADDEREREDLSEDQPGDAARARSAIDAIYAADALELDPAKPVDDALVAQLRALGYAGTPEPTGGLPHPLAPSDRPSPRERRDELERFTAAVARVRGPERAAGIVELRSLAAQYPENAAIAGFLAAVLTEEESWIEAIPLWRMLIERGVARAGTFNNIGVCYEALGRDGEAVASFRAALEKDGRYVPALENLARVLEARGEAGEAAEVRDRLQATLQGR